MNYKTILDKERQRFKIVTNSIYGFWADAANTMEFKISPTSRHTRIKIMKVNSVVALERISFYCGLQFLPKRTKWKGFDFITHLDKVNEHLYKDGLVHIPNATRQNRANLRIVDNTTISVDFYFIEAKDKSENQNLVGSLTLVKQIPTQSESIFFINR
jgi:hypothetical protein